MINVKLLEDATDEFFTTLCKETMPKPKWSGKWKFKERLPHNDKKGCYAHLKGDEVVYIGLAIGNSFDGIGARVSKYWKKREDYSINNQAYEPTVKDVDAIITLPFESYNFYLAAALEIYLIQNLDGLRNKAYSKNKGVPKKN